MSKKKGYIKLSWQGIHDEYIIEYSTDNQNWQYLATVKATTYTHTNLDPDTLYYYRVWGVKNGIKSVLPATISGYAKDTTPPPTPTNITVTPTIRGFSITIEPPTVPDWDGFEIHVSTQNGFTPSPSTLKGKGKASTFEFSDLDAGTTYYIRVISYDRSGNKSNPSPQYSVTAGKVGNNDIDATPPSIPTGLSLTTYLDEVDASQNGKYPAVIKATWNAVSDDDLEGYQIRIRKISEQDYRVFSTKDTYYLFTNLKPGTQFGVQVRAYDRWGNYSNWSSEATITSAGDSTPPATPTSITAQGYFKTIVVRWNEVTDADLAGYELYASQTPNFTPSPQNLIYVGKSNSYSFSADVNQTWYFKVRSYDTSLNYSNYSVEASASTAQIATADISANSIASQHIQAGAITTDHLSANAVTAEKIATEAIQSRHLQAESITVQHLSADTNLIYFATSFENDTDGDGIPDGFSAEANKGSVSLDTTTYWRGRQSVKLYVNGESDSYAMLKLNHFIPTTVFDWPLLVYFVAKVSLNQGNLYLIVEQFDKDKNKIQGADFVLNLYVSEEIGWHDGIATLNAGALAFYSPTQYIKLSFKYVTSEPDVGTSCHIDFLKIYPLSITTADMATIQQGNIFMVKPVERLIWYATGEFSTYAPANTWTTIKTHIYEDMEFNKITKIFYKIRCNVNFRTRLAIYRYYWAGRRYTYDVIYTEPYEYSGSSSYYSVAYYFTDFYPTSWGTFRVEVQGNPYASEYIYTKDFYCYGGSWVYAL